MENKDIILIIIIIFNIYLLYKMNKNESFANGVTTSSISTTEPSVNQVDILNQYINNEFQRRFNQLSSQNISDSIKNLGLIAKKIQDNDGDFTFPANLKVYNDLTVNGNVNLPSNNKLLPEGCILMWGQIDIPEGWVLCDGSAYLRKEFLNDVSAELPLKFNYDLFLQINESTRNKYIRTPNLSGRFILGSGTPDLENNHEDDGGAKAYNDYTTEYDINMTGGERRHELNVGELPNHQHYLPEDRDVKNHPRQNDYHPERSITFHNRYRNDETHYIEDKENKNWMPCYGCNGNEHNNMPPYHVLNYIMKVY